MSIQSLREFIASISLPPFISQNSPISPPWKKVLNGILNESFGKRIIVRRNNDEILSNEMNVFKMKSKHHRNQIDQIRAREKNVDVPSKTKMDLKCEKKN